MTDDRITVHAGDCLEVLRTMADNSIDSCVTDPPYHLTSIVKRFGSPTTAPAKVGATGAYARASAGFMGKQWDGGDIAFRPELWAEVLRVLKPGGHLLAFGGSRTYHRLACAVEDAGFEIRDQIMWVFGSGFPKSHDVSKGIDKAAGAERDIIGVSARHTSRAGSNNFANGSSGFKSTEEGGNILTAPATDAARKWEGWGTALKPAHEPIVLARKPLSEATVAANVLRWGTGAINVDGCRVESGERPVMVRTGTVVAATSMAGKSTGATSNGETTSLGRWPANLIHDGSDEVVAAFPEAGGGFGKRGGNSSLTRYGFADGTMETVGYGDAGSAARFFKQVEPDSEQIQCVSGQCYSPIACAGFGYCRELNFNEGARLFYQAKASKKDRMGSSHPTVKPVKLMQYLVRLITPPGGTVLDCFAGTGTTGQAAITEGCRAILIEREEEYLADIDRRFALSELRL